MKLVKKNNQTDKGSGQCREVTNSGSQCTRDAIKMGFCKQHYKLRVEKGLIIETLGDKLIKQIPEIPEELGKFGRQHFQIYCQYMIDQGRLYQIYVMVLKELCYLEEQLEKIKEDLETYGAVNFYDSGPQVSGYATRYKDVLRDIRNLRKDLGLTSASEIVKIKIGDTAEERPKKSYADKKAKGWD